MRARRMASVYAVLALLGAAAPLAAFLPWLGLYGFDPIRFVTDPFANRVSSFFALDVVVSALVLIVFVVVQGARDHVGGSWLSILVTLLIGVSCGLPLFLALRERALAAREG